MDKTSELTYELSVDLFLLYIYKKKKKRQVKAWWFFFGGGVGGFFFTFYIIDLWKNRKTLTLIVHFLLEERYTPYGISLQNKQFL